MENNKLIELPKIKLRDYQYDVWDSFFNKGIKRFINVWHRRAGKDETWLNTMIAASQLRVGTYLYTLPKLNQARKVIWDGIDRDGKSFLDRVPKELIAKKNSQEMTISLKNGSIIRFGGSDYYNSLMGTNPIAIIHSEFSLQNPFAWDYLRPILAENEGWAAFVFTPRGMNHGYNLYNQAIKNKDWYCNLLTVDDTKRLDGTPVISKESIDEARRSGMSEDMIQQEFYCSWTAAVQGAYFSTQLKRAEEQNRIKDFIIDSSSPVFTSWDLGVGDSTSIWLFQYIGNIPHAIMYFEDHSKEIQYYINLIMDFRNKYGFVFSEHFLPNDSRNRNLQTGKNLIEYVESYLKPITVVDRCKKKIDAIESARRFLDNLVIHKTNCSRGLACLREYHSEFIEKNNVFRNKPAHNWASHGADAFQTYAQYYSIYKNRMYSDNNVIKNVIDTYTF